MIFVFVLLLHNSAYAQLRGGGTEWRTFEVPEFGTRVQFPASIFAPAGKPLSELMDVQPSPFTLARTIRGRTRRPTYGAICAWIAPRWIITGSPGHFSPSHQNEKV
jgi:hypothetical protein